MQVRFFCALSALASIVCITSIEAEDIRYFTEDSATDSISAANSKFTQAPVIADSIADSIVQAPADAISSSWNCGSGCCGNGCQACPPCGWFVSLGLNVFRPQWATNQALATSTPLGGGRNSLAAKDFNFDYQASPFIDFGYVAQNGLGFRVGYWDYSANSSVAFAPTGGGIVTSAAPLSLTAFANPNPMRADATLAFQVWDAELTQQIVQGQWWWQFAGGVRYLHIAQGYNVTTSGAAAAVDDLVSSHHFSGAGPTLAVKGQRQLGTSYFSLYGLARGSALFGDNSQNAALFSATGTHGDTASQTSRSFVGMTELEMGVWYQRSFNRFILVATGGVVGQYWSNVGNSANTDIFSPFANDEALNNTMGMGLFGIRSTLQLWF
jgi:hypothetical protein